MCLLAGGGGQTARTQEDLVVEDCQQEDGSHAGGQQGVEDLREYPELNIIVIVAEHVSDDSDLQNLNKTFILEPNLLLSTSKKVGIRMFVQNLLDGVFSSI